MTQQRSVAETIDSLLSQLSKLQKALRFCKQSFNKSNHAFNKVFKAQAKLGISKEFIFTHQCYAHY